MSSAGHLSELDLLRGQVADLSRQLAERDRSMQDLREQSQLLRTIVEGAASGTGDEFFASLVRHLTSTLHVQYAVISEVLEVPFRKIRTLAVSAKDTLMDNFEYELVHTPCAAALTQTFACFNRDLQATFPEFQRLVDLGAESYCAVPIRTKDGEVSGLLVVMDTKPLENINYLQSLLEVFAPRIAAEFERRRAEQERAKALADLHNVIETIPDIVFALNTQGNLVKWNRRLVDVTGYSPDELLNMPALAFVPPEEQASTAAAIQRAFTDGYAELEGHLLTKDHRLIPYHWTGALLKSSHGEPIGITGIGRDVSDKKRVEEALHQSDQRFALAVEGSNDILWDAHRLPGEPWYATQTPIWWSPRVRKLLGLQESDSFETFEQWAVRLHPDDKDRVFGQLAAHIEHRVPYDVEYRLRTNAGDYCWIRGRGQALWDEQGEPRRMSGSCQDITERKQVEKALCESEERYRTLIDLSPNGVFVYCNGKKVYVNQVACTIFGASSPEQLLENPTFHFSHPDAYDSIHDSIAQILATGEPVRRVERKYQRLDGTAIFVEVDAGRIMWNGEPAIQVIFADITERKQAEKTLRESETQFRALAESTTDWMWEIDEQGRYTYCSPKIRDILGYEPKDALGKTPFDFMPEEEARRVVGLFGPIAAARKPFAGIENTNRHKDGRLVILECRGTPVIDDNGLFRGYRGFDQDITDRKQAEEERQKHEVLIALMLNTGPACIKRVAADGSLLHMNPTGLKLVEACGETEAVGRSVFGLIAPEHRDAYIAMHRSVIEGHECMLQFEIQGLKGTRRWMESEAVPFRNPATGQTEQLAVTHDITERKRAEEALRESEAFNISVLNSLSSQIVVLNSQGVIMAVNKPWLRFAEENEASHLVENFVGMNYLNVCAQAPLFAHGEEAASAQVGILAVLAGTQNEFSLEYPCHSPDQQRWFRMRVTPLLDSQAGVVVAHENITERKLAEEALRASEERLRLSLEAANQGIYDLNAQTGEALVSSGYVTMLDYDPATFRETNAAWIERSHPDDRERVADYYRAYVAGEIPEYRVEFRQRSRGGDWRWILSVGRIVERDARGEPLRMLGTHTDITERKQAEEALRASEERFTLAVRGSNTGIWDWDLRTDKTYFSPLWKSMLGYEEHELRGELFEWEERLHPDDRKRSSATVRAYLEGGTSQYELEHRLRHKDGSYRWILARGVSLSDAEGKPYRMAGSHIDITEQKQIQEALAQSERQLRTVLDALPLGVWFTDRSGKPLLVNPMAKQIWSNLKQIGLQTENHQAGWWETIGPASEPHRWALSHVLTTGVPSLNETFDFECLDGTKKTIRNSTVPVKNESGATLGAIVLNEDITLLRQAQAALQLTQFSVDHAVEGFIWIGSDARIFHVNDSTCQMLEYTWEELTTMTLHDIDPNFSSEGWYAHWEELKEKGSLTFESKYWSKTGRVLDMEVTVNYLQYEGKEYNCAIMRDIGERKRVQAALRESEARYRSLYDETPTMYFTLATDGTVLSVNRFGAEQLGYQVEELTGHSVLGLFHEDDKETVAASLSECFATPARTKHWEFRKVRKDGSVIWVRETAHVGQSSSGETIVLVTCEDMTERKRVEEELRKSHAFIRQIIDTDPNFIFAKDREGRFILVNKAVADAYGTTVDNLIGKTDADFNPNQAEVAFFRQKDLAVMDNLHELFLPEEVITDSGGRTRWLQTVKRPILDDEGRATMVLGASTDITERKRMEETLHQRERDLRAAIEERERISQDLHDGILQSLFAVGLTLEASKSTMSSTARKTSGPPLDQAIDQLNQVMREIRNFIAGLGSDLLQGRDLSTALEHMLTLLTQNQAMRVRLAVEDRAAKAVSADQSLHLFRVIQEAVSNCIRHGRAQEARVSLKMLKQGVRLSIRDNGRGFNQDAAKKTGHGLVNMAARAQKIGGRLTVLSKVNKGTSIVLDLPATGQGSEASG